MNEKQELHSGIQKSLKLIEVNEANIYSLYEAVECMIFLVERLKTEMSPRMQIMVEEPLKYARHALRSVRVDPKKG